MFFRVLLVTAFVTLGFHPSLRAGVMVEVEDLNLVAGGTGFIDVSIYGTMGEAISSAGYRLQIEPLGMNGGSVSFTDPQPELDDLFSNDRYLFKDISGAELSGSSLGTVSDTTLPNDTFTGFDSTILFDFTTFQTIPVPLPNTAADAKLISRLQVKHNFFGQDASQLEGKQFSLKLISAGSIALSASGTPLSLGNAEGTITIVSQASPSNMVPEPSSLAIFAIGGLGIATAGRRRRTARNR